MFLDNEVNICDITNVNSIQWHIDYTRRALKEVKAIKTIKDIDKDRTIENLNDWIHCLEKYTDEVYKDYVCGFYDVFASCVIFKPADENNEYYSQGDLIIVESQI